MRGGREGERFCIRRSAKGGWPEGRGWIAQRLRCERCGVMRWLCKGRSERSRDQRPARCALGWVGRQVKRSTGRCREPATGPCAPGRVVATSEAKMHKCNALPGCVARPCRGELSAERLRGNET